MWSRVTAVAVVVRCATCVDAGVGAVGVATACATPAHTHDARCWHTDAAHGHAAQCESVTAIRVRCISHRSRSWNALNQVLLWKKNTQATSEP